MLENLMARGCQLAGVAACRDKGTQVGVFVNSGWVEKRIPISPCQVERFLSAGWHSATSWNMNEVYGLLPRSEVEILPQYDNHCFLLQGGTSWSHWKTRRERAFEVNFPWYKRPLKWWTSQNIRSVINDTQKSSLTDEFCYRQLFHHYCITVARKNSPQLQFWLSQFWLIHLYRISYQSISSSTLPDFSILPDIMSGIFSHIFIITIPYKCMIKKLKAYVA